MSYVLDTDFARDIFDSMMLAIAQIRVSIRIRGRFDTMDIGPWTPPSIEIVMCNVNLKQTDCEWKDATPKKAKHVLDKWVFAFREAAIGSLSIYLRHGPPVDHDKLDDNFSAMCPMQVDVTVCGRIVIVRDRKSSKLRALHVNSGWSSLQLL